MIAVLLSTNSPLTDVPPNWKSSRSIVALLQPRTSKHAPALYVEFCRSVRRDQSAPLLAVRTMPVVVRPPSSIIRCFNDVVAPAPMFTTGPELPPFQSSTFRKQSPSICTSEPGGITRLVVQLFVPQGMCTMGRWPSRFVTP